MKKPFPFCLCIASTCSPPLSYKLFWDSGKMFCDLRRKILALSATLTLRMEIVFTQNGFNIQNLPPSASPGCMAMLVAFSKVCCYHFKGNGICKEVPGSLAGILNALNYCFSKRVWDQLESFFVG